MSTTIGGRAGQQELAIRLALAQAEATPDGLLIVSPDGRILSANPRFTELWRVDQELIATGDAELALAHAVRQVADPDGFVERVRQVYADPVPTHEEVVLADGRVLDRYGAPLHDDEDDYIGYAWWFRDVTPSKEAQAALRELADTLQASLLPPRPPHIPGMEVAARYRPGSPGMTVGGDFYDVFRLRDDAWGVVLGDVCGKGAQAAALTALARYSVRAAAVHNDMPSDVLRELNTALLDEPELRERFCALVFAKFEQDTCGAWVTLSCAGHPLPLVVRRSGWVDVRGQSALLAGLFTDIDVTDDLVGLGPGDAIVCCTDGITEARGDDGELFGEERLFSVLSANAGREPGLIADAVIDAAVAFSARPIDDDVAILVLRVPPNAADDPEGRLRAVGVSPVGRASTCATAQARQARPRPPREAPAAARGHLVRAGGASVRERGPAELAYAGARRRRPGADRLGVGVQRAAAHRHARGRGCALRRRACARRGRRRLARAASGRNAIEGSQRRPRPRHRVRDRDRLGRDADTARQARLGRGRGRAVAVDRGPAFLSRVALGGPRGNGETGNGESRGSVASRECGASC